MMAMSATDGTFYSCKVTNTHTRNPDIFAIPSVIATRLLSDTGTAYPIMLIASTLLTTLRTAVTSSVATKYLSKKSDKTIGIIGNGSEAMPHLHTISLVRKITKAYIYDVDIQASKLLRDASNISLRSIDVNIEETPEAVARKSDTLVTLTTKERDSPPLVLNDWIRDGTHINAVGGDSYRQIELEQSREDLKLLLIS